MGQKSPRYHPGGRWADRFCYVVGVGHTNYLEYSRATGFARAPLVKLFTGLVTSAYCDQVVLLSAALAGSGVPSDASQVCKVHVSRGICTVF